MGRIAAAWKQHLALSLVLALLCPWPSAGRDFFLQEGTEINLRLRTRIDTKISQTGDRLIATVEDPIDIDNVEVIPAGTRILGRVGEIRKPGRFGRGGRLVLTFEIIDLAGAGNVKIAGSLVDLYDPDYEDEYPEGLDVGQEGQVKAGGTRKLKRFGGAVAGGGLGAAAAGGAGGAIGLGVGAVAAYIWFKGKHIDLPPGTGLVMRVDRGVILSIPDMPQPAGNNR